MKSDVLLRVKSITWQGILVSTKPYYERVHAWWLANVVLRQRLTALSEWIVAGASAMRDGIVGRALMVWTGQVQSRDELRTMTPAEIMDAYRGGRMAWLMHNAQYRTNGTGPDRNYREWISKQRKPIRWRMR